MRIILQRVLSADVSIETHRRASIAKGFLLLLGITHDDTQEDADWLAAKVCGLRVFADGDGKMNLDLMQTGGEVLVVSQFTLHASVKKGNRPSFIAAARPEQAIPLYTYFIDQIEKLTGRSCATGEFGADMQVSLVNDGPVTLLLDSKNRE